KPPAQETASAHLTAPPPAPTPTPPAPPPERPVPDGMVAFAAGTLHMGRDDYGTPNALDVPAHDVKVGAFTLQRAEVTQHDYADFVATGKASALWKSPRELERHG